LDGGEVNQSKEFVRMKKSPKLAMATAVALGLAASVALAQEPGFGGHGDVSKNQIPGPNPSGNPTDPAAGNPGSPAQIPTAPQKQENLEYKGANGAATGETGTEPLPAPPAPMER
jgi:hypothetical protein